MKKTTFEESQIVYDIISNSIMEGLSSIIALTLLLVIAYYRPLSMQWSKQHKF